MKRSEKKTNEKKLRKETSAILPICYYEQDHGCYRLENGKYLDIVQIIPQDLQNMSDEDVEYICLKFARFYKTFLSDIKIVTLNYPCNTSEQQSYIEHKLRKRKNPVHKKWLTIALKELQWLQEHKTSREFYYFIFSDSLDKHEEDLLFIKENLGSKGLRLVTEIDEQKKNKILFKLNNKNSIIK